MPDVAVSSAAHPTFSRRMVLASLTGLAADIGWPGAGRARDFDNPPIFRTVRSQFVMIEPRRVLPAVALTGLDGGAAALAPSPGNILLVNIWATWCELCRTELPMLDRFQSAVGSRISVAAISTDKAAANRVRSYLNGLGIQHLKILLDPMERAASSDATRDVPFPIYGMPVTYLITPSGWIAGYIAGASDWFTPEAQRLLAYYAQA